jgi:hypothetical protein
MTDLETFHALLAETPPELRTPEIDGVMRAGARIRRRRRLFTTTAIAAGVAAVLTVTAGTTVYLDRPRAPGVSAGAPIGAASPGALTQGVPGAGDPRDKAAFATTVVATGIRQAGAEVVLYLAPVQNVFPNVHFGVLAGVRSGDGHVTRILFGNEVNGTDRAPGFHAVQAPLDIDGYMIPEFGYYAGPAVRIAGEVGGRPVTAHQAEVVFRGAGVAVTMIIFWFDPGQVITNLTAYDANGRRLPTGDADIHHG